METWVRFAPARELLRGVARCGAGGLVRNRKRPRVRMGGLGGVVYCGGGGFVLRRRAVGVTMGGFLGGKSARARFWGILGNAWGRGAWLGGL